MQSLRKWFNFKLFHKSLRHWRGDSTKTLWQKEWNMSA